jgi:hypothetical protein
MSDDPIVKPDTILTRYQRLSKYVGLDLLDLERCFMVTPNALQEAGELVAAADQVKNETRDVLAVAVAAAADRQRQVLIGGKEPSQARIDSLIPLDRDVMIAKKALSDATYEADLCQVLFRSLEVQSRLLGKAADMVVAGYLSPTVLQDQARAGLRAARIAADRETVRRRREDDGDDADAQ